MRKELVTCDMCGTILDGPGVHQTMHVNGSVTGGIPHPRGIYDFYTLDLCEDDWPVELFDGAVTLLFGGEMVEGEMIEIQNRDVIAVVIEDATEMTTSAYSVDSLTGEQQRYVNEAVTALRNVWQQHLEESPRYER